MRRHKKRGEIAEILPPLSATLTLTDMPDVLAALRYELAAMIRHVAEDEPPAVAERLRAIAAAFEAGQTPGALPR